MKVLTDKLEKTNLPSIDAIKKFEVDQGIKLPR